MGRLAAFRMVELKRDKSGSFWARKAIPPDTRDQYKALYGKSHEAWFRAPRGCAVGHAKALFAEWEAEVCTRIEAIRAQQRGEGRDLTPRGARALAGAWYQWFTGLHHEDPGKPEEWETFAVRLGEELVEAGADRYERARGRIEIDYEAPEVRAHVHPLLADAGRTAQFLASRGEVLSRKGMTAFLDAALKDMLQAASLLKRRAEGDYSPDPHLQTLPPYEPSKGFKVLRMGPKTQRDASASQTITCTGLFEAWVQTLTRTPGTVSRWRGIFPVLDAHLAANGWTLDDFGPDEAQRWADSLIGPGRSAATVRTSWVGAPSSVLGWAAGKNLIKANPFKGVVIDVPKKATTRVDGKAFSDEEQRIILKAALAVGQAYSKDELALRPITAAYRWVPWLCAYSGARGGEITQLRGQDIKHYHDHGGCWAMLLTPDAGTIKTKEARAVPIHEHLIEQGFLDYVRAKGAGPLFYEPVADGEEPEPDDPLNPRRPRADVTRSKVGIWVRALGIRHKEIRPNHAWRHAFKQRAARANIEKVMRDAICGHAGKTEGDKYDRPPVWDMAKALERFPRYELMGATASQEKSRRQTP